MIQVNVQEAKTQLSALLREVERGETVTIANWGKPVARLTRIESVTKTEQQPVGFLSRRGVSFKVPDNFHAYRQDEFIESFETDGDR